MARDKHRKSGSDRYERARSDEEPGAHSGGESRARERSIPGTASAREGYQNEGGTVRGEALEGVRARDEDTEGKRPGKGGAHKGGTGKDRRS
ncbi:hypothetical protein [Streptomyces triculaminicus]|uniref:hypothetical protein n=1 Tax=Streptomyces triculaminicus TaxID=2816232 RepID=UPI0037D746AF